MTNTKLIPLNISQVKKKINKWSLRILMESTHMIFLRKKTYFTANEHITDKIKMLIAEYLIRIFRLIFR